MLLTLVQKIKSSKFFSESAVYLLSSLAAAAVPFILLPIITRYLTPSQYGEVAMFQTLIGFFGAFVGLSSHLFVARKFYDFNNKSEMALLVGSCIQMVILTTSLLFVFCFFFKKWLVGVFGIGPVWLYMGALVCAGSAIIQIRLVCWQVNHKAKTYGLTQIAQAFTNFLLSIILVVVFLKGANGRMSGQAMSVIIISICSLVLLRADGLLKFFIIVPKYFYEILKFGFPLIPHVLGVFLLMTIDRFIINGKLGLTETGLYMVGVQISLGLGLFFDALNKAFIPWLYESLKENSYKKDVSIVKLIYWSVLVIIFVCAIIFYGAPKAVSMFLSDEYQAVSGFIGWLLIGQALSGLYLIFANFIFYSKKTGLLSLVSIVSGIFNVLLLLYLIESRGIDGAAIAFCLAMLLRLILTWVVSLFSYPMPWFGSILYKKKLADH